MYSDDSEGDVTDLAFYYDVEQQSYVGRFQSLDALLWSSDLQSTSNRGFPEPHSGYNPGYVPYGAPPGPPPPGPPSRYVPSRSG